jgi:dTMP kinase
MTAKRCYLAPPPGLDLDRLSGLLVVLEGPDSAGRSTQVEGLAQWLEHKGYAVEQVGIKRSPLVSEELERAQQGNVLSPRTMSLFYATDFYDQLENRIVPALRSGFVVLADRYIFTLMARAIVRGADPTWLESLYSRAIVPDAVFYLSVSTPSLVERTLTKKGSLDYWESGMDIGISRDWYESFVRYQRRMRIELKGMMARYGGISVNANRSIATVRSDLRARLSQVIGIDQE